MLFSLKFRGKSAIRTVYNGNGGGFSIEFLFVYLRQDNILIFLFADEIEGEADEVLYPLDNETYGHANLKRKEA